MDTLFDIIDPILLLSSIGGLILFALAYYIFQTFSDTRARNNVKKRLTAEEPKRSIIEKNDPLAELPKNSKTEKKIGKSVAKKANDFYASSDPNNMKKLRIVLLQAGYLDPGAVGYFIAARFFSAFLLGLAGVAVALLFYSDQSASYKAAVAFAAFALGYFLPNAHIHLRAGKIEQQNREGFPDILDLMVVSAEAGLTMEASIERISMEIKDTYPNLSIQLNLAALEIRAGRPIDQALRAFGERLRLEEVKGFATMIQQAKEFGTSVTDALRVYSDEMRHKRMMKAEEKAYALPAKMSVPVTLFILPTVIFIAIIPTIVRWNI